MRYETLNWDDRWAELVDPLVDAHEADPGEYNPSLEEKYDRRYVESASCQLYVERLLENLQERFPKLEFAAHTDTTGYPPNSYWRVLARQSNGKPLTQVEMRKLRGAAKAIRRNIEKKCPGVGEEYQRKLNQEARQQTRKELAKYGLGVRFGDEPPRKGCLFILLVAMCLVVTLV